MMDKNSDIIANKLVNAFLKNKIIKPIPNKYTKKISNAQKFRKLCESKIKKPIIGFKAGGTGIAVIKKLKRYKNEIDSGADFSIIAKKYSEDFSATNGGEIGWISEGLEQNFDDQLSIIEKNEVSEPFKTDLGWHIIQYSDYKFDDIAAEKIDNKIKFELINERTELLYQDWFSSLKAESFIEVRE